MVDKLLFCILFLCAFCPSNPRFCVSFCVGNIRFCQLGNYNFCYKATVCCDCCCRWHTTTFPKSHALIGLLPWLRGVWKGKLIIIDYCGLLSFLAMANNHQTHERRSEVLLPSYYLFAFRMFFFVLLTLVLFV